MIQHGAKTSTSIHNLQINAVVNDLKKLRVNASTAGELTSTADMGEPLTWQQDWTTVNLNPLGAINVLERQFDPWSNHMVKARPEPCRRERSE